MPLSALITLHEIDGQPLVHDENLAYELGYSRPRKIRDLIKTHHAELEDYGPLAPVWGKSRGQEFAAYYLNEEQALLLCMFSGAEKAKEIRREIIQVYQAWRKGHLKPAMPDFTNPAEAARAWALEFEQKRALELQNADLEADNELLTEEVDTISQTLARNSVTVARFMSTRL